MGRATIPFSLFPHRMGSNHESTSLALSGTDRSTSRGGGGTLSTIAVSTFSGPTSDVHSEKNSASRCAHKDTL